MSKTTDTNVSTTASVASVTPPSVTLKRLIKGHPLVPQITAKLEQYNYRATGIIFKNCDHYLIYLTECDSETHAKDVHAFSRHVAKKFKTDELASQVKAGNSSLYSPYDEVITVALEFRLK